MSNDFTITVKIGDEEHTAELNARQKEKVITFLWLLGQIKSRLGPGDKADLAAAEIMKVWLNYP